LAVVDTHSFDRKKFLSIPRDHYVFAGDDLVAVRGDELERHFTATSAEPTWVRLEATPTCMAAAGPSRVALAQAGRLWFHGAPKGPPLDFGSDPIDRLEFAQQGSHGIVLTAAGAMALLTADAWRRPPERASCAVAIGRDWVAASGHDDGRICLWSADGQPLRVLQADDPIVRLAYLPAREALLVGTIRALLCWSLRAPQDSPTRILPWLPTMIAASRTSGVVALLDAQARAWRFELP
jgi:hypothetical protein